nr:MAG TPA: hypothetical protein [Caudoviricetes sp.]
MDLKGPTKIRAPTAPYFLASPYKDFLLALDYWLPRKRVDIFFKT